jgi:hypothetical protein
MCLGEQEQTASAAGAAEAAVDQTVAGVEAAADQTAAVGEGAVDQTELEASSYA